jgi:hypothetical protein
LDKDRFERLDDRSGVFRHDQRNKSFSVLASKSLASMGIQRLNQQVSLVGQKMPRLNLQALSNPKQLAANGKSSGQAEKFPGHES